MNTKALVLALVIFAGTAWAQSGQASSGTTAEPEKTPVTYNPQDAPPSAYKPAGQLPVNEPAIPSAVELPTTPEPARRPAMPDAVDIPTGPPSVSQPGVPTNNYGPAPPSGDGRLMTTPMIGPGAPAPISNTYPGTPSGSTPQPPTCDKVCY